MVLNREDFLKRIKEKIGDDTSDESISFVEDMTDTFDSFSTKETEDWKKKYEENDRDWREKYTKRFFSPETTPKEAMKEQDEDIKNDSDVKTFDELFYESEEKS